MIFRTKNEPREVTNAEDQQNLVARSLKQQEAFSILRRPNCGLRCTPQKNGYLLELYFDEAMTHRGSSNFKHETTVVELEAYSHGVGREPTHDGVCRRVQSASKVEYFAKQYFATTDDKLMDWAMSLGWSEPKQRGGWVCVIALLVILTLYALAKIYSESL